MAELLIGIGEWPHGFAKGEVVSAVLSPSNDIFFGCTSGRIYCLAGESLAIRMIMCSAAGNPIVAMASSYHLSDQPHAPLHSLITLDAQGNLSAWSMQDGKCLMHNATDLIPSHLLQLGDHLIVASEHESLLFLFNRASLEMVQTVEMPAPVKSVVQLGENGLLMCHLLDSRLCTLHFDQAAGRFDSMFTLEEKYEHLRLLDALEGSLLLVRDGSIVISSSSGVSTCLLKQPLVGAAFLTPSHAILWNGLGELFELTDGRISRIANGLTIASASHGVSSLRLVTTALELLEMTLVGAKLVMSRRVLPVCASEITAFDVRADSIVLGSSDGACRITSLASFYLGREDANEKAFQLISQREITSVLQIGSILIEGTSRGEVCFFDIESGDLIEEYMNHSRRIVSLFIVERECPEVIAVAADSSLSIYRCPGDLKVETLRVIPPRRNTQVRSVQWVSPTDEFLLVEYSDELMHMWNIKSGRFEGSYPFAAMVKSNDSVLALFQSKKSIKLSNILAPMLDINVREVVPGARSDLLKQIFSSCLLSPDKSAARKTLSFGVHGAGGNTSFISPAADIWNLSPIVSANILLALSALMGEGLQSLLSFDEICLPSISSLSKFWMDPNSDLQEHARKLISMVISRLPKEVLKGFAKYWLHFLPASSGEAGKSMNRAAIILGIVCLKSSETLEEGTREAIAKALLAQINGDRRNLFRAAAIELLGDGYAIWRPFFQPLPIFRALFVWLVANQCSIDVASSSDRLVASVKAAEETLCRFIMHEKYAILPYWLADLSASKSIPERTCGLGLLLNLLEFGSPPVFKDFLLLVLDHVVRMLEPGVPLMRAALLGPATKLFFALISSFSSLAWHKESQRLLAGSPVEGTLVMFDLKSANRTFSFEGLTKPCSAVAFAPDGKHVCAYAADEGMLYLWAVPSGLLSILGHISKCLKKVTIDQVFGERMAALRHSHPETFNLASIHWASERTVQLSLADGLTSNVNIF